MRRQTIIAGTVALGAVLWICLAGRLYPARPAAPPECCDDSLKFLLTTPEK